MQKLLEPIDTFRFFLEVIQYCIILLQLILSLILPTGHGTDTVHARKVLYFTLLPVTKMKLIFSGRSLKKCFFHRPHRKSTRPFLVKFCFGGSTGVVFSSTVERKYTITFIITSHCSLRKTINYHGKNTALSRGVRSLFGPTRKSSPWGNFSDGGSFVVGPLGWLIDWK